MKINSRITDMIANNLQVTARLLRSMISGQTDVGIRKNTSQKSGTSLNFEQYKIKNRVISLVDIKFFPSDVIVIQKSLFSQTQDWRSNMITSMSQSSMLATMGVFHHWIHHLWPQGAVPPPGFNPLRRGWVYRPTPEAPRKGECRRGPRHFWNCLSRWASALRQDPP